MPCSQLAVKEEAVSGHALRQEFKNSKISLSCLADDKNDDCTLQRRSHRAFVFAGGEAATDQMPKTIKQYCLAGVRILYGGRLVGEVDVDEVMVAGSLQTTVCRLPLTITARPTGCVFYSGTRRI